MARIGNVSPIEYYFKLTESGDLYRISGSSGASIMLLGSGSLCENQITRVIGRKLDPFLADWLEIAFGVYWAERLAPRRDAAYEYHDGQRGRILNVEIPVRELTLWASPTVYGSLCRLLEFFTEDKWQIKFTAHKGARRAAESQDFLFQITPSRPVKVSLFSGGLDSFAGAVGQMSESSDHTLVLVSGANNTRKRAGQTSQYEALTRHRKHHIRHVTVWYQFHKEEVCTKERLERSRGFLFLSLGAVTALAAGSQELHVYENGIGAINLPYDATQLGISNTRAVSPIALLRMSSFITNLTANPFLITNPYLFQTKAEMCQYSAVGELGIYIPQTFSCDGFPMRIPNRPGTTHCGCCTSCLLRRVSLEAAGLSRCDPSEMYLRDLSCASFRGRAKHLRALQAMEWQAYRIKKCLGNTDPWRRLVQDFPELNDLVSESLCDGEGKSMTQRLIRLYSQYVSEWESFSARRLVAA